MIVRDPSRRLTVIGGAEREHEIRPRANRSLPFVRVDLDLDLAIDEASQALAAHPRVYERAGRLVDVCNGRIRDLHVATIRELLAASARYMEADRTGRLAPKPCPDDLVQGVAHRGSWGARELRGVTDAPYLRRDGTICQAAGYDPATCLVYAPRATWPAVPDLPTRQQAEDALSILLEPLHDFPWRRTDDGRAPSLSAFLALVFTLILRPSIRGSVPGFLISANSRGTGKSRLASVASWIGTGAPLETTGFAKDDEEVRKKITSHLRAGDRFVCFDNVKRPIGGESIEIAITSETWSDRALGSNDVLRLPNQAVFVFTGNNLTTSEDASRRFVPIELETRHVNPEDRIGFRIADLGEYLENNRTRLVVAVLTIARAWWAAGCPQGDARPLGSFEGWSRVVPPILTWLGHSSPLASRAASPIVEDSDRSELARLADWWERFCGSFGVDGATVGGVVRYLYPVQTAKITPEIEDFRAELESLLGESNRLVIGKVIGYRLRMARRRPIDASGRYFEPGDVRLRGERRWMVVRPKG